MFSVFVHVSVCHSATALTSPFVHSSIWPCYLLTLSHFPCQAYPLPTMPFVPSFDSSGSSPCPSILSSPPSYTHPSPSPAFQCHYPVSSPLLAVPGLTQPSATLRTFLCPLPLLRIFIILSSLDQQQMVVGSLLSPQLPSPFSLVCASTVCPASFHPLC